MAQKLGSNSSKGGRLTATGSTDLVAGQVSLGAGWGGAPDLAITAGSNDQAGRLTITAAVTTPAEATATVALTYTDLAYPAAPVTLTNVYSDSAITDTGHIKSTSTTTVLTIKFDVLPVATKIYVIDYVVIAI